MAKNKARKWSNLKGVLPDEVITVSPWMKKVLEAKDRRTAQSMDVLAAEYADLKEAEAQAEEAASERKVLYKALDLRILEELDKVKEMAGTDTWRGEDGVSFSPKFTPRPSVNDLEALMDWIHDTDQDEQLTLPAARLKSIVCEALDTSAAAVLTPEQREQLKPGDPASGIAPPGVSVFLQTSISRTGGKKKPSTKEEE